MTAEAHIADDRLPPAVAEAVGRRWRAFLEAAGRCGVEPPRHPDFLRSLSRVWAASEFVATRCIREPALLRGLLDSGDLLADDGPGELAARVAAALAGVRDEDDLARRLRRLRTREMVRIAWRDLAGWASLEETLRDLSGLADACIDAALGHLHAWLCRRYGRPKTAAGRPQQLVVLGMGKLGAGELNFSSDIDLVFAFPEPCQTRRRNGVSCEEFFTELGQGLIRALDAQTPEGFVFRVDMRLRPYGDSGPLVMSFDALEEYYQSQGREWERYAMIKARPVAGDAAAGQALMEMLRPFVYRRYLDFGAFEQLRDMKAMIEQEVARRGLSDDIKLGPGGIREVEFIVQVFQLVRGGREPALRERRLLVVLERLAELGLLPPETGRRLADAYRFLRRLENRLQAWNDEQTHQIPADPDRRLRLALAMGFDDWDACQAALERHRGFVAEQFQMIFAAPQGEAAAQAAPDPVQTLARPCFAAEEPDTARRILAAAGCDDPDEMQRLLAGLCDCPAFRHMGEQGRQRLERLMPLLLGAVLEAERPAVTFGRVLTVLEAIAGRSVYLALLVENPMALSQFVRLCAASPWITHQLARHPLLLDELLDPRALYAPMERVRLEEELARRLEGVAPDDLETQMEVLRQFKHAAVLRVAAADVVGAAPLMVVSDYLTWIAEVVLVQVLALARAALAARHGAPQCVERGRRREPGFAIIAYGKLGGIELNYGSDLDLVFVHDSAGRNQRTDGPRPLDNGVFFIRLAQRIVHMLDTLTPSGTLYEVDTRLRPNGASGLLAVPMDSFADYQRKEAWTWEHQALVRARAVAGDDPVRARFARVRREILGRPRDPDALRRDVREMRLRMRAELGSRRAGQFDLKQDPGGIADIEFMVQYGVLRWAAEHEALLRYTDNIRLLEALAAAGLLAEADAAALGNAYRVYRQKLHALALQERPARVPDQAFLETRQQVMRIWRALMEE